MTPIPVTTIGGYLGAGKTTLVNGLLAGGHGLRIGVLVNDFGAISIDEKLIVSRDDDVVTLANGCACCSVAGDLAMALDRFAGRTDRYEQIVIEMHDFARLGDEDSARNVLAVLSNIHSSHVPIHVHANNEAPVVPFGTYWFPDVLEVTYLRRADASAVAPASEISIQLDRASNARFADLSLSGLLTVDPITV